MEPEAATPCQMREMPSEATTPSQVRGMPSEAVTPSSTQGDPTARPECGRCRGQCKLLDAVRNLLSLGGGALFPAVEEGFNLDVLHLASWVGIADPESNQMAGISSDRSAL